MAPRSRSALPAVGRLWPSDDDDREEEDADDVDVCGDQLPDQTKITLRMIGIFKIPAGRLREDKLPHDPPVENAS